MALILNIETSSPVCSVSVARDGKVLYYREDKSGTSHARLLTVFIDELIKQNSLTLSALDAVAVSRGPGSYTGLRVGYAVAKGLCYALEKPLIVIPTLLTLFLAMKQKVKDPNAFFLPVMDARRMDVYTTLYDANGKEVMPVAAPTLNTTFEEKLILFGQIYIGGNATEKCKQVFTSPFVNYLEGINNDSRWMSELSENKFHQNLFEDVAYAEPFYLKEFGVK